MGRDTATSIWISLVAFVVLYAALGTVDLLLMLKHSRQQLPSGQAEADQDTHVPAVQY